MAYLAYNVVASCVAPWGALWLSLNRRHRPLLGRFLSPVPGAAAPLWVQACSVGEVGTAKPFVNAFLARHAEIPVLLTTSTIAGHDLAAAAAREGVTASWFPFDLAPVVRRFLHCAAPRALVLVETELWPNVLREADRSGVPSVLLNGRLSDKHYGRYWRARRLLRPMLRHLTAAGMQNEEYAERLAALGMPRERIHVTGCTKFDGVTTAVDAAASEALRAENGFALGAPVVVFGSTRPGDEALAARCWVSLREEFPALRLVVAPRHLDRLAEALAAFDEPVLRRSEVRQGRRPEGERVFVLDTVGELVSFYALATVAVVGGSFYPGVNGHNPLEPAALGVPTVFGPYMRNFIDPARVLSECRGAAQVGGPDALLSELRRLLREGETRAAMAARGREGILANQGAIDRSLDLLDAVLKDRGEAKP